MIIKRIVGIEGNTEKVYNTATTHRNNYGIHIITDANMLYGIYNGDVKDIFKLQSYNKNKNWCKILRESTCSNHIVLFKFKSDKYYDCHHPCIIKKTTYNNYDIYLTNDGIMLNKNYNERFNNVKDISYNAILFNNGKLLTTDEEIDLPEIIGEDTVKSLHYNHFITESGKIYYFKGEKSVIL